MAPGDFELAQRDLSGGKMRDAEVRLRQILVAEPGHGPALDLLGAIAHQTGHLAAAIDLFRRATLAEPANAEFHHHFGLALMLQGDLESAIAEFRRVNELAPELADSRNSLGAALKRAGHAEEAIVWYREALRLRPGFPEASNNLGTAIQEQGKLEEAIAAFKVAIAARPNYAEAMSNLGNALRLTGQAADAVHTLTQATAIRPDLPEIHYNLGLALQGQRKLADAEASYRRAVALRPDYAAALNNLGNVLEETSRFPEAITLYRRALELRPDLAESHNNMATALRQTGALDQAIAEFRDAIALKPGFVEAHSNLGNALAEAGLLDEAEAEFHSALAIDPAYAEASWNLGLLRLLRGDFDCGLEAYEFRNRVKASRGGSDVDGLGVDPEFIRSFWDGSDLHGKRILLLGEQGLGDTIQFVRFVPMVRSRNGRMTLLCQPALMNLMRGQLGIEQIAAIGQTPPEFDVCCPLMSLPHVFGTRIETIPSKTPYLNVDPVQSCQWRERLAALSMKLNVGLVWAGNPTYRNDRNRSIPLAALAPLARVPGIRFISLQKGEAARQAEHPPAGMEIVDWTAELVDFTDTAALIENLDLVISVDTAVAHLAGALARPVWVLLPLTPDWRWMLDRADSPWYPTMRLFRQPMRGDWATPITKIAEELRARALWEGEAPGEPRLPQGESSARQAPRPPNC
jgi:tetratricopeptide (TPR) repeat protein